MAANPSSDQKWLHRYSKILMTMTLGGCLLISMGMDELKLGFELTTGCCIVVVVLVGALLGIISLLQDIKEGLKKIKGP